MCQYLAQSRCLRDGLQSGTLFTRQIICVTFLLVNNSTFCSPHRERGRDAASQRISTWPSLRPINKMPPCAGKAVQLTNLIVSCSTKKNVLQRRRTACVALYEGSINVAGLFPIFSITFVETLNILIVPPLRHRHSGVCQFASNNKASSKWSGRSIRWALNWSVLSGVFISFIWSLHFQLHKLYRLFSNRGIQVNDIFGD